MALPVLGAELEPVVPLWVVQAVQASEDREARDGKRRVHLDSRREWLGEEVEPELAVEV